MILRPKRKEKGVRGVSRRPRGRSPDPFSALLQLSFWRDEQALALTRNVACHPAARPAAPTDSASPAHQHLSYWTLMTLELALVARFPGKALAEAGTSGAIPTHFGGVHCARLRCARR